jgi:hypothetical protein
VCTLGLKARDVKAWAEAKLRPRKENEKDLEACRAETRRNNAKKGPVTFVSGILRILSGG